MIAANKQGFNIFARTYMYKYDDNLLQETPIDKLNVCRKFS